jgi:Ni,Fe-hydrogenase III component G
MYIHINYILFLLSRTRKGHEHANLGVMLKCNGNFNVAVSLLMEKARKAYFKIKKTIELNNPCKPVIAHLVFNLTSKVDRKWGCYT